MADIPRFDAQIQSIQTVRMKDYEYEQNRSIYQTMKKAGETISNTFFEMVAQGKLPFQQQQNQTYWDRYLEASGYNIQTIRDRNASK